MQHSSPNDNQFDLLKKLVNNLAEGGAGSVGSVNGQTGIVVLDAADVGAAPEFPAISSSQTVYVDKGGNDSTGNGTPSKPYKTIAAAMAAISDAAANKPYQIFVGPGTYAENVALKAFCFLSGFSLSPLTSDGSANAPTYINGNLALDASWGVSGPFGGYSNVLAQNLQGQVAGNTVPVGTAVAVLLLREVRCSVSLSWRDVLSRLFFDSCDAGFDVGAGITVRNGKTYLFDSYVGGALSVISDNTASFLTVFGGSINNIDLEATNAAHTARFVNCDIGDAILNSPNAMTCSMDVSSYPKGTITLQNGAVITRISPATSLGYTPAVTGNWTGADPVNVQQALDRIAAALGPIA